MERKSDLCDKLSERQAVATALAKAMSDGLAALAHPRGARTRLERAKEVRAQPDTKGDCFRPAVQVFGKSPVFGCFMTCIKS